MTVSVPARTLITVTLLSSRLPPPETDPPSPSERHFYCHSNQRQPHSTALQRERAGVELDIY